MESLISLIIFLTSSSFFTHKIITSEFNAKSFKELLITPLYCDFHNFDLSADLLNTERLYPF